MFITKTRIIKYCLLAGVLIASINLLYHSRESVGVNLKTSQASKVVTIRSNDTNELNKNTQLDYIFIGGYARSGTTLMVIIKIIN